MTLALDQEHRDLAAMVAAFVAGEAPLAQTRADLADHAAGRRTPSWDRLVAQGLHAVHLPEAAGGDGAGLTELAVIAEALAGGLFPGPFLATARTGMALALAGPGTGAAGERALRELAAGATGVLVEAGLRATPAPDGWEVSGETPAIVGLPGAEVVLVRADTGPGAGADELWFRLAAGPGVEVSTQQPTDLTRSIGRLRLSAHRVVPDDVLPSLPAPDRELVHATLAAAEASGLSHSLLETCVEHLRTRHQFGRPLGSFQALQHRAALMLVEAETAAAAAWDAARAAASDDLAQRALAAAQAATLGPAAAMRIALDAVSLLGAIGFTWEHDAHLYWRRALGLAGALGPDAGWALRLGRLALDQRRDFALVGPEELPELRAELGPVLDLAMALPDEAGAVTCWGPARGGSRRAALAEAGLVAPHYPAPYGRAAGPREQSVIAQEFAARGLTQPTTVIGEWVLPTLLEHGSPEQRERFVLPTLRGDLVWCQLFSEPGAGSDLAGLSTRATKVEGGWLLTGQKVWNSYAHLADWGICLARTDQQASRHAGISYFLLDMRTPGVEVRPIRQATGRAEFNEVFLEEVFVPDDCLVGTAGEGWRLAGTTLANERLNMGMTLSHGGSDLIRRALTEGQCALAFDEALTVLGRSVSREMALGALTLRGALAHLAGNDPGVTTSVQKVFNAIAQRDGSRAVIGLLGPALLVDEPEAPYAMDHLGLPAVLLGGGTVEIQLNLIARRVLGLPGEPR